MPLKYYLFAVVIFIISFITAYVINLKYKFKTKENRYNSIDGLRGFLGISVFIHHAIIWYVFAQDNVWKLPKSNLYIHLGETSVAFFFMISSFLFINKLLNTKGIFNWKKFFFSRFFRLAPLYFFSLFFLFMCVMQISNWELKVEVNVFIISILKWVGFTILGEPIINNVWLSSYINGPVWSLPYEWLFYFSLPIISLFVLKRKPPIFYIIISVLFIIIFIIYHGYSYHYLLSFLGGAIAPFIKKYSKHKLNIDTTYFSVVVLVCLALILLFNTSDSIICKLFITIAFTIIALGNNFFGILKSTTLKFLGEISYSTYLMHCIILFIIGYFIIGIENMKAFSKIEFSVLIFTITPVIIIVSFLSFYFIEKPFINFYKKIK